MSVIIPAYNAAPYIGAALDSVFAQTFTDYEVVVVNDGSPDTDELERVLGTYDGRIVYIKQENRGPSGARNTAILNARGEYVALLDGDDMWMPQYLAEQMKVLQLQPALDLIYADALLFGDSILAGRTFMETAPSRGPVTFKSLLLYDSAIITTCTVARRKSLIDAGLFDEKFIRCEDFDLWLRLAHRGGQSTYQRQVLARHRLHRESLASDRILMIRSQIEVLKKVARTLDLSLDEQELVKKQLLNCEAQINLEVARQHFIAERYAQAAETLKSANGFYRSRKLRLAHLALRTAPHLTHYFYSVRYGMLTQKPRAAAPQSAPDGAADMDTMGRQVDKAIKSLYWLPAYGWQRSSRLPPSPSAHLVIALADHFEPAIMPGTMGERASLREQERRLNNWCRKYPEALDSWRDAEGFPLRHTYFYPAEQYDKGLLDRLAEHCHDGWGEIEIHLHHGVEAPDTADRTERILIKFRDTLVKHGSLSRWNGEGEPRYAFVHGNWALANSAGNWYCGVDEEMQILADTGCFADLTLPSMPSPAQVAKINALYECTLPLHKRAPHRRGRDLRRGQPPHIFPLIIQGPLGLNFARRVRGVPVPYIENSAITTSYPPTMHRLDLWRQAAITVKGQPDWVFIKLHCHGMDPRDESAMLGGLMQQFLSELVEDSKDKKYHLHFVTAREMVNIALAACDGREGSPGDYRDYRFKLITTHRAA